MLGKFVKFLVGVVLCVGVESQMHVEKFDLMINRTLEECRVRENATIEEMTLLFEDNDRWPESHEGKCLIECFFEDIGIFKNHKFYKRGFLSLALMVDEIDDNDTEKIEVFNAIVELINEECGKIKSADRCEIAVDVAQCFIRILDTDFIEQNFVLSFESIGSSQEKVETNKN